MAPERHTTSSSRSPRKKCHTKLERLPHYTGLMIKNILQSQQTDANGEFADTLLICSGGTIRVHAFILQAASPLIQEVIMSQGENYPYIREILLPDFSVKEIERMLNLVYKGYVDLKDSTEVQSLRETLKFFQISGVEFGSEKIEKIKGSLKVQELNRIPQDLFKSEVTLENKVWKPVVVDDSADKTFQSSNNEIKNLRRSGRAPKPIVKLAHEKADVKSDDSDYKAESGTESSADELSGNEGSKKKRGGTSLNLLQPVLKLPRIENSVSQKVAAGTSASLTVQPISTNAVADNAKKTNKDKDDSETDTEDEDWVQPDFKNKEWFSRESRRCQSCKKTFDKPAEASLCISLHKCLRCYFCFKVYSTTDVLFKHFHKRHKQAGRENTLLCPFCDQAIPYKSVSCHVISVHLRNQQDDDDVEPKDRDKTQNGSSSKASDNSLAVAHTPSGSKVLPRPRSRSQSTEVISSSNSERDLQKKVKSTSASSIERDKKRKGAKLTIANLNKLSNENSEREYKVPDLDVALEKITACGRTITFNLKKKRLTGSIGDS